MAAELIDDCAGTVITETQEPALRRKRSDAGKPRKPRPRSQTVTVRIPVDVEERIIATANAVGTSRSDVVLGLILKALQDAPNGYTLTALMRGQTK